MKMKKWHLRFALIAVILSASTPLLLTSKASLTQTVDDGLKEHAVIYGKKGDGLPDTITLEGNISDTSFAADCGLVRGAGALKIRLAKNVKDYPHKDAYVVVPCLIDFPGRPPYLNKGVCMTVKKMLAGERPCHADYIHNTIDSHGLPFYCLTWQSGKTKEFLSQVACPEGR